MKRFHLYSRNALLTTICGWLIASSSVRADVANDSALVEASKERVGVTNNEVLIGACLPLTGALKERGNEVTRAANLYFNAINAQGGVLGRKLRLVACDDAYDPDKAIECFNSCLKDKVFAAGFFAGSAPIAKYVRMGESTKTPLLGFVSGNPSMREFRPTEFALRASYNDEVERQVDELWRRGVRKIAVLYQNDAAGAAVRETVTRTLKKYNTSPVAEASYARKSTEVDAPIASIRAKNPEAVVYVGTSEGLKATFKNRYQNKWNALFISVSISDDYVEGLKEAEDVVLTQVLPPLDTKLPAAAKYEKLLHSAFPGTALNMSAWEAFLISSVFAEGIKRAGPDLTRTKFIEALETMRGFDLGAGPNFRVNFSAQNHNGWSAKSIYFTIVHDGKVVPINESDWGRLIKAAKKQSL